MNEERSTSGYNYIIVDISEDDEIGYKAVIPKFPKMMILGDTPEQLHNAVCHIIAEEIEDLKKEGKKIPKPDRTEFSGKFLLRVHPELHENLTYLAQAEGTTLNKYVTKILEEKVGKRK